MKSKIIAIVFAICLFSQGAGAQGILAEADSAYAAGKYESAVELYQRVAEEEGTSAALLYNLGNACFQTGDYGNAMLSWLRARRLAPGDETIQANINYLQSRVEDANKAEQKGKRYKVVPDEPSFFQSVKGALADDISSDTWAVWAAVAFIVFVAAVALYIFSRTVILRKTGFFGGMVSLLFSLVFVIFAFMSANAADSHDTGVVTAFKVTLLTEPGKDADANKGGVLTKGTVVQILSEEVDAEGKTTWYKVRMNTDYIGWVAASDMAVV